MPTNRLSLRKRCVENASDVHQKEISAWEEVSSCSVRLAQLTVFPPEDLVGATGKRQARGKANVGGEKAQKGVHLLRDLERKASER